MRIEFYYKVRAFILRPAIGWTLVGINIVAGILGMILWYGPDFGKYAWWGWIFVPDCPLVTLMFALAWIGILFDKKWTWYNALTCFGLMKYALWTVTVWVLFWSAGYPFTFESVFMTINHIGMGLEGVMLASFLPGLRWRDVLIAGGWYFLADFMDYGLGFHPRLAPGVSKSFMMWEMLIASVALTAYLGWRVWRQSRQPAPRPVPSSVA
jgi:uncharacterized membrane protein YpjA